MRFVLRGVGSDRPKEQRRPCRIVDHVVVADNGRSVLDRQLLGPEQIRAPIVTLDQRGDAEVGLELERDLVGVGANYVVRDHPIQDLGEDHLSGRRD